jgi:hypothetical protein
MKNGVAGAESSKPWHALQDRGFPSFSPGHPTYFVHFVRESKNRRGRQAEARG